MSRNDILNQRLDRIVERRAEAATQQKRDRSRLSDIDGKGVASKSGWLASAAFLIGLLIIAFTPLNTLGIALVCLAFVGVVIALYGKSD